MTKKKTKPKMLTVLEAAEKLGVSGSTVRSWINRGRLKAEREYTTTAVRWLIPADAVAKFKPLKVGRPKGRKNQGRKM